jgi:serine/threonine protein kinase
MRTWQKHSKNEEYEKFIVECTEALRVKLKNDSYQFDDFNSKEVKSKIIYDFSNGTDELVVKKLNDNIRRLFKISPSDRHSIVKQTVSLMRDAQPIGIIRLDIKNFYESLDRKAVIKFVNDEWLLSYESRVLLREWDKKLSEYGINGLPRGMSLSSTLSEIRLRRFDQAVRTSDGVFYYARYVDDIIVFFTGNSTELFDLLCETLKSKSPELKFNNKTKVIELREDDNENKELNYLGYKIIAKSGTHSDGSRRLVRVLISDKKISKIKNRVRRCFTAYTRDRNFNLLISRLRFLSANQYIIGDIERTKLKSGIYYNYPLINERNQLWELDKFYQTLITTKVEPIAKAIRMIQRHGGSLNNHRIQQISKISFIFGFNSRVMNSFSKVINRKIKRCW